MADAADAAGNEQEFVEELLLRRQQFAAAEHRKALGDPGACLNCEEPLTKGRFCDEFCRDDYERRVKARQVR